MSHVALNKYNINLNQKLLNLTEAKKGAAARAKPLPLSRNRPRVDLGIPGGNHSGFLKFNTNIEAQSPTQHPSAGFHLRSLLPAKVFFMDRNAMTSAHIIQLAPVVTLLAHAGHPSRKTRCRTRPAEWRANTIVWQMSVSIEQPH
jgi:hypothetical protein